MLILALASWANRQVARDVGLVRRLVFGEARVALDAEVVRLDLGHAWVHVDQALL